MVVSKRHIPCGQESTYFRQERYVFSGQRSIELILLTELEGFIPQAYFILPMFTTLLYLPSGQKESPIIRTYSTIGSYSEYIQVR